MSEKQEKDVLLKVEHLSIYFGKGKHKKKAVDDVSFDVRRGEVFGLVGESGCGKTTTERTIIKLYDATGGSVYFKGKRIVAGTQNYSDEIAGLREKIKELSEKNPGENAQKIKEYTDLIAQLRVEISKAKHDHKNCDAEYRKEGLIRITKEYEEKIATASG